MPSERELIAKVEKEAQLMADSLAAAEYWHDAAIAAIDEETRTRQAEIERGFASSMTEAKQAYDKSLAKINHDLASLSTNYGLAELEWNSREWEAYTPSSDHE